MLDYGFHHLERIIRLLKGDETALGEMDISADGFWRSFSAIILALPALFFSWVIDARYLKAIGSDYSIGAIVITNAVIELVAWILPIFLLAGALYLLGLGQRFSHLIIVRNWMSVLSAYALVLLDIPALFTPNYQVPSLLFLAVFAAIFAASSRLYRIALGQKAPLIATTLVAAEMIFTLIFILTVYNFFKFSGA